MAVTSRWLYRRWWEFDVPDESGPCGIRPHSKGVNESPPAGDLRRDMKYPLHDSTLYSSKFYYADSLDSQKGRSFVEPL